VVDERAHANTGAAACGLAERPKTDELGKSLTAPRFRTAYFPLPARRLRRKMRAETETLSLNAKCKQCG
jgi:hypothetical protein